MKSKRFHTSKRSLYGSVIFRPRTGMNAFLILSNSRSHFSLHPKGSLDFFSLWNGWAVFEKWSINCLQKVENLMRCWILLTFLWCRPVGYYLHLSWVNSHLVLRYHRPKVCGLGHLDFALFRCQLEVVFYQGLEEWTTACFWSTDFRVYNTMLSRYVSFAFAPSNMAGMKYWK